MLAVSIAASAWLPQQGRSARAADSVQALMDLGDQSKDNAERLRLYSKALTLWTPSDGNHDKAQLYLRRGLVFLTQRKLDKALSDLDRAVEADPGEWTTHSGRATVFAQMGRCKDAIAESDKALRTAPDENKPALHNNKGTFYLDCAKDNAKAAEAFQETIASAVKVDSKHYGAAGALGLGVAFCRQRQFKEGMKSIDRSLAVDHRQPTAFYEWGKCLQEQGTDYEIAADMFSQSIRMVTREHHTSEERRVLGSLKTEKATAESVSDPEGLADCYYRRAQVNEKRASKPPAETDPHGRSWRPPLLDYRRACELGKTEGCR